MIGDCDGDYQLNRIFYATSPDLTSNGVYVGSSTQIASNWDLNYSRLPWIKAHLVTGAYEA